MEQKIVLFDGVCNFCNDQVQFLLKHDHKKTLHFASLQSEFVRNWIQEKQIILEDSIYFIEGNKIYSHSTAVLRIAKELGGWWKLFYLFILIPKPIRDYFYHYFARHRYQWFGKSEVCMLPSPELRERFYT